MTNSAIQSIINQILYAGNKYDTESAHLNDDQIDYVLENVKSIMKEEPTLLKLSAPITLVGDIHGQLYDLRRILNICGDPSQTRYLFLGDYVDRGFLSLDTVILLFCYKILYPQNIFLLRGNHEFAFINRVCGFKDSIQKEYGNIEIFHKVNDVFDYLSLAALINDEVFCSHAGLSPKLNNLDEIDEFTKPVLQKLVCNKGKFLKGVITDMLFADCDPSIDYWRIGYHNLDVYIGPKAVDEFLEKFNLKMICRGHEVCGEGIDLMFPENESFVTVFSAPKFKILYDNKGAVMHLDENLEYTVTTFNPVLPRMDPLTALKYGIKIAEKNEPNSRNCEIF